MHNSHFLAEWGSCVSIKAGKALGRIAMRSVNVNRLVANQCYKVDSRGLAKPESLVVSAVFFYKPGMRHVVFEDLPEHMICMRSWLAQMDRLYRGLKCPYEYRMVSWNDGGFFIYSVTENVFESLVDHFVLCGYHLSSRPYAVDEMSVNPDVFPFHSPHMRTLRPPRLLLQQPQLLLE